MIKLILDHKNNDSFEKLIETLNNLINSQVYTFVHDPMLRKIEDYESLYNLALLKVSDAANNFEYDSKYTEKRNELRFLSMVKTYIKNIMIDHQYAANSAKRKPDNIASIQTLHFDHDGDSFDIYIPSNESTALEHLQAKEFDHYMKFEFNEGEESDVYLLLSEGYPAEKIAGKLGITISRVRHIIYHKIQVHAEKYV